MRLSATTTDPMPRSLELSDLAAWVRCGGDDPVLWSLLLAAQEWAEGVCNQPIFDREYKAVGGRRTVRLPGVNVTSAVLTYNLGGSPATLGADFYTLQPNGLLSFEPAATMPGPITYTFRAGYPQGFLPEGIKQALRFYVAHSYDIRANPVSERFTAGEMLLKPYTYFAG